jgi:hypothetical protein
MFEDVQKQVSGMPSSEDEEFEEFLDETPRHDNSMPGLTPRQRFTVAFLVLMMTVIIGIIFLLVNAKIVPPFVG